MSERQPFPTPHQMLRTYAIVSVGCGLAFVIGVCFVFRPALVLIGLLCFFAGLIMAAPARRLLDQIGVFGSAHRRRTG